MSQMQKISLSSKGDGLELSVLLTLPLGEPEGIVQLCHGMSEHKERYLPLMEYFNEQGYIAVLHDHRGHGESIREVRDLGYFYHGGPEAFVEDLYRVTVFIKEKFPGLPLYLLGHSMGSLVARAYLKQHETELNGLILCGSPSLRRGIGMGKLLAKAVEGVKGDRHRSKLIHSLAFGSFKRSFSKKEGEFAWLCTDEAVVRAYEEHTSCGFVFTAEGFSTLFALMEDAYRRRGFTPEKPELPIWFLSGAEDPCMLDVKHWEKAQRILRKWGYRKVSGTLYPGMRHEILNEKGKQQVFADITEKIDDWNKKAKESPAE